MGSVTSRCCWRRHGLREAPSFSSRFENGLRFIHPQYAVTVLLENNDYIQCEVIRRSDGQRFLQRYLFSYLNTHLQLSPVEAHWLFTHVVPRVKDLDTLDSVRVEWVYEVYLRDVSSTFTSPCFRREICSMLPKYQVRAPPTLIQWEEHLRRECQRACAWVEQQDQLAFLCPEFQDWRALYA